MSRSSVVRTALAMRGGASKMTLPWMGGGGMPPWVPAMVATFLLTGVFEISGGWLVWKSVREGKPWWWALLGCLVLSAYGFCPTLQPEEAGQFGRLYATYGAYFIVLSLGFAYLAEGQKPDTGDFLGAGLAAAGAAVITFWPRSG